MCRESTAGFLTGLGTHSRVGSGGPFLDHVVVSSAQQHEVARALANRLGIPHLELDSIFHQPGWEPRSDDEFRAEAAAFVAGERWVVDGNYTSHGVTEIVWPRADTIVWLDPPRRVVMRRVVSRTLRRVVTREELWNGNRALDQPLQPQSLQEHHRVGLDPVPWSAPQVRGLPGLTAVVAPAGDPIAVLARGRTTSGRSGVVAVTSASVR